MFGLEWYWSALIVCTTIHLAVSVIGLMCAYLDGDDEMGRFFARGLLGTPIWPLIWLWGICALIVQLWAYAWEKDSPDVSDYRNQ